MFAFMFINFQIRLNTLKHAIKQLINLEKVLQSFTPKKVVIVSDVLLVISKYHLVRRASSSYLHEENVNISQIQISLKCLVLLP